MTRQVRAHGIQDDLAHWISIWSRGRNERIVAEGCFSNWRPVTSEVTVVSVVCYLLFVIYIIYVSNLDINEVNIVNLQMTLELVVVVESL